MTINEVLEKVDALKPNVSAPEQKADWIISLDARINNEIVHDDAYTALEYPNDGDSELLAADAYSNVYELYVLSMIAFFQEDYTDYNFLSQAFNAAFEEYAGYYRRSHTPEQTNSVINLW